MKSQATKIMFGMFFLVMLLSFVSALTISDVRAVPEEVAPGETVRLNLEIENEIGEDVEDVIVSLDLTSAPFAPYQSSTEELIEELDDGDDDTVLFHLIALSDAEAKVYKIPVTITYKIDNDENLTATKTSFISLSVNAKPILLVEPRGDLIRGRRNALNIEITNSGLTEAKFLNIGISEVGGINILGPDSIYLGDIDSDDFDSAGFEIFLAADTNSKVNLPVKITYRDATNKLQEENIILQLTTYSKDEAIELGLIKRDRTLLYVGIIVAVIILWFIYRGFKKRKRRK